MTPNNPANVPPLNDVRFIGWDKYQCTLRQLGKLRVLLRTEGIQPADLYGDGFTSVEDLSRWGASWGISLLESRAEARWIEHERKRIEWENEDRREQAGKKLMGMILREHMKNQSNG